MKKKLLELKHVCKAFNNKKVLTDINLSINSGEITCLLGKNGAGKTVLMSILMGILKPDEGSIYWGRKKVKIEKPMDAYSLGISMVFQEQMLLENMSVAENIYVYNDPPSASRFPIVSHRLVNREARKLLDELGFDLDHRQKVKNLTFAQKQIVSIVKAVAFRPKLLIMDEPATALVEQDAQKLFHALNMLKTNGVGIVFVSHHLGEVMRIADRIFILRDSKIIGIHEEKERFDFNALLFEMTGEELTNRYPRVRSYKGDSIVEISNLSYRNVMTDVNFSIREGEIVGIFGLEGSGKEHIGKILCGLRHPERGTVTLQGKVVNFTTPFEALKRGVTYLGEEFKENLILDKNIAFNVTLSNLSEISFGFYLFTKKGWEVARYFNEKFKIVAGADVDKVAVLSGGAKQKVAISKCLFADTIFLILEEVSKYLDIPSKVELYNILNKLAANGISILLISSDVEELIGMCDKILVFYKGTIIRELRAEHTTSAEVLFYASEGIENRYHLK